MAAIANIFDTVAKVPSNFPGNADKFDDPINPTFEKGKSISKCGHWRVEAITMKSGGDSKIIKVFFDEKPITMKISGILHAAFDMNAFQGKPTPTMKLPISLFELQSLPVPARESMKTQFAQFVADQRIIRIVIENYCSVNGIGFVIDPDRGTSAPPRVTVACKAKASKPDPKNPGAASRVYVGCSAKISSQRGTEGSPVETETVTTSISIREESAGKMVSIRKTFNRGTLNALLHDSYFFASVSGTFGAFVMPGNLYITFTATTVNLFPVQLGPPRRTDDEIARDGDADAETLGFDAAPSAQSAQQVPSTQSEAEAFAAASAAMDGFEESTR